VLSQRPSGGDGNTGSKRRISRSGNAIRATPSGALRTALSSPRIVTRAERPSAAAGGPLASNAEPRTRKSRLFNSSRFRMGLDYFVETVFNYPTLAECYKVAALDAHNKLAR